VNFWFSLEEPQDRFLILIPCTYSCSKINHTNFGILDKAATLLDKALPHLRAVHCNCVAVSFAALNKQTSWYNHAHIVDTFFSSLAIKKNVFNTATCVDCYHVLSDLFSQFRNMNSILFTSKNVSQCAHVAALSKNVAALS
jgi:hypothetical protein